MWIDIDNNHMLYNGTVIGRLTDCSLEDAQEIQNHFNQTLHARSLVSGLFFRDLTWAMFLPPFSNEVTLRSKNDANKRLTIYRTQQDTVVITTFNDKIKVHFNMKTPDHIGELLFYYAIYVPYLRRI